MSLEILNKNNKADDFQSIISDYKKQTAFGVEYYYKIDITAWDAKDGSSGYIESKNIVFNFNEYFVSLSGIITDGDISDVSIELALDIMNMKNINGLTVTQRRSLRDVYKWHYLRLY